jgi:uncharacterized protein with GYD domain
VFAVLYGQIQASADQDPQAEGEPAMAKYMTFFTYTSDAWARMIQSPGDRTATIRQVADSLGGSVECVYWVFGTHDGMVITDFPDSISAAGSNGVRLSWGSVSNRVYSVQRASGLLGDFSNILQHIPATPLQNICFDPAATNASSFFYRIRVE